MSATKEPPATNGAPHDLADELHRLEAEEERLESRTRRLELSHPLALLFSLLAMGLALGAFVIALSKNADREGTTVAAPTTAAATPAAATPAKAMSSAGGMNMPATGKTPESTMMGVGGHGTFSSDQVDAANHGVLYVQLGDFWAAPTVSAIHAGKVTFKAKNVGRFIHELMVERAPIKMIGPGQPLEDAAQGMIDDMQPGQSGQMTLRLKPGKYVLFCNVSGHYAAGQHIEFTVTG